MGEIMMINGIKNLIKMMFDFSGVPFELWYSSFIVILFTIYLNIGQPNPSVGIGISLIIMSIFFFIVGLFRENNNE